MAHSAPVWIQGGTIADGTGGPLRPGNLLIRDGLIEAVLPPSAPAPDDVQHIDATGLVVAPGFIDTHSHSELAALWPKKPAEKLLQGITTEIAGQDGLSVAPVIGEGAETILRGLTGGLTGGSGEPWTWRGVAELLQTLDRAQMPTQMGYLVPHSAVRVAAMGAADRPATDAELAHMCHILDESLAEGGLGLSTGLIYPPCSFADWRELVALCAVAARWNRPLVVHMRSEASRLVEATAEMVALSRESGVQVHISHMKVMGRTNWHLCEPYLAAVAKAREEGLHVTGDTYPYAASSTVLRAVLPPWTLDGGLAGMLQRLATPMERQRIRESFRETDLPGWENRGISFGWENIVIASAESPALQETAGHSIAELAAEAGEDPIAYVCDLLLADQGNTTAVYFQGAEANIEQILRFPGVNLCTDGIYGRQPHPRLYGSFARLFGHYVRERGILNLAEAVHKVSGLAAANLGIKDRGRIAPGLAADVTIFNPATITDEATFANPKVHPPGIETVLVGGQIAVSQGHDLGAGAGRALRASAVR